MAIVYFFVITPIGLFMKLIGKDLLNNKLDNNKKKYEIALDLDATDKADAAKIFFTVSKASTPILSLELRYKGKFTPQPQFFANITPQFKEIMVSKCLVPD